MSIEFPQSIAIRSSYRHHAANSGYKQILKFTKPIGVFGRDENTARSRSIFDTYLWLYEFQASRFPSDVDLVHILYAEEYFRFSPWLFPKTPLIATFHQPPDTLEREISKGDGMGRVAGFAHRMTKKRFSKLAAAIALSPNQVPVLESVIPRNRIHLLPLGADIEGLITLAAKLPEPASRHNILTVGNWRRDWKYYFDFVEYCRIERHHWHFVLINRKLPQQWCAKIAGLSNLKFVEDASDETLFRHYKEAALQFLPFEAAAGNNSLNEGLAFGCPVVTNLPQEYDEAEAFIKTSALRHDEMVLAMEGVLKLGNAERSALTRAAQSAVMGKDWSVIAEKTLQIYTSII